MVAVIGGETHRFRPLIDLYRQAGAEAGHPPQQLKVGLHSLGYVANSTAEAVADYYPGYAETFTRIGKERGWPPVNRARFDAQNGPTGALLVGGPEEIAEKIRRHSLPMKLVERRMHQRAHEHKGVAVETGAPAREQHRRDDRARAQARQHHREHE